LEEVENERATVHALKVREWRSLLGESLALDGAEHRKVATEHATKAYPIHNLRKCQHVFLDFGANIGDSLLKLIDSSLPELDLAGGKGNGTRIHYSLNATTGSLGPDYYDFTRRNPNKWILPKWVHKMITSYNNDAQTINKNNEDDRPVKIVAPEDYCYYGVEGNPVFTSRLRRDEIQIMNMLPRPVRHLHFLTEHVGAGADGPTTLYLDTINQKHNYWGSSMIQTHTDVLNSNQTGVPVMGITLTRLLKETVLMPKKNNGGGHVMIKIDIEGGEYKLLEEAIRSKILCKLVLQHGVRIDMLNEPHNVKTLGSEEPEKRWKHIQGEQQIKQCGVGYSPGFPQF
jgi:hypothetical protein